VLSDVGTAAPLRAEPLIAAQLAEIGRRTRALLAAGSCSPGSHVVSAGVATATGLDGYLR
jgi:hypothetical protein